MMPLVCDCKSLYLFGQGSVHFFLRVLIFYGKLGVELINVPVVLVPQRIRSLQSPYTILSK